MRITQAVQGSAPVTNMKDAKKAMFASRYEPYKFVVAVENAMQQGIGKNLDSLIPVPRAPAPPDPDRLRRLGALIILSDQEPKQSLESVNGGGLCSRRTLENRTEQRPCHDKLRTRWINQLMFRMNARIKFRVDFVHRIHNDAQNPIRQLGLAGWDTLLGS